MAFFSFSLKDKSLYFFSDFLKPNVTYYSKDITLWKELNNKFPQNSIPRMVGGIRSLSTPLLAAQIRDFFENHPVPQGQLTLDQHLEKLGVNVALREREGTKIGR